MNLPTQHQIVVAGTQVATAAASVIATLGVVHLLTPADVTNSTAAIGQITDGIGKIMTGAGTLIAIGSGVYATIMASPFASIFRASKAIASDPAKLAQLQATPTDQQAALVTVTDRLPDVAGVGTVRTAAGQALANAVPSPTVQPVQPTAPKVA
jgi:hypothetical protein